MKTKILWIDLNCSYAHASLALPALHAQMMDRADVEWQVVSATVNENPGSTVEKIFRHRPDILAATAWLFNHEALLHIASRAKALLPHCQLVLGGPEFLGDNEAYLRQHPYVDAIFRGEGEESFPQWMACRTQKEAWRNVDGLCYLESPGGAYIDNGTARVARF